MATSWACSTTAYTGNAFLGTLSKSDAALIVPLLTPVRCKAGERLTTGAESGPTIYFPLTLVASLGLDDEESGLGLVGREGVIGWSSVLGLGQTDHGATVLFEGGMALTLPTKRMRLACYASPTLSLSLLRFAQAYTIQLSCMIRAGGRATLRERLSAWLLLLHDRIDGDVICISHKRLAHHLHVRRASITDCLHQLESELAVRCERCSILIRDRTQLAAAAGVAYARTEESYRRLMGPFGKGSASAMERSPAAESGGAIERAVLMA